MRVLPADGAGSRPEILGHLIRLRRPDDTISLVHATISGYPATMLQRVRAQTPQRHRPGWVALLADANDTPRYGSGAGKPRVTGTETARNLTETRSQAAAAGARVIWTTRPPATPRESPPARRSRASRSGWTPPVPI